MEALFLSLSQQRVVLDIEQVVDDEPDGLVGGHPVLRVEALQIYRNGKAPQRALAPQVEVGVEVTHGQLAQRAVDRLAPAASAVVRFRDRAPASVLLKDGDDGGGGVFRLGVEQAA